jgi:hypothetical protein
MRFSTGTLTDERTHRAPTMNLGCTPETHRRASDLFFACRDMYRFARHFRLMATRRSELRARDHTSHEVWHPSSDISAGVRSTWGFHAPAPSARGCSQPFDGLLLRAASLSCFVQAPLMGFKEQEQTHRGTWCVLGSETPKSHSTSVAPRVDNSSDQGHSLKHVACFAPTSGTPTALSSLRSCRPVTHQHPRKRRRWEADLSTNQTESNSIFTMHRVSSR